MTAGRKPPGSLLPGTLQTGILLPGILPPGKLPPGKLPPGLLDQLLSNAPILDGRIILGAGIGLDCAVVDPGGDRLLVFKSDPITFTSEQIGWYAVQVNANDIACTGAEPCWFLATLLLPEGIATAEMAEAIFDQVYRACKELKVSVIGGHTEVTAGLDRPLFCGTLIGEVERGRLVTPKGLSPGDRILLTKGVPIEAVSILARELPERLAPALSPNDIDKARNYLFDPGISVVKEAHLALAAGRVSAMHDPTEGGLYAAVWEMAQASGCALVVDPSAVPVPELAARACAVVEIDPLASIASGALLIAAPPVDSAKIAASLEREGIRCAEIGFAEPGPPKAWQVSSGSRSPLPWPERDEIARIFSQTL
jgi:hydrogenase maturation factor